MTARWPNAFLLSTTLHISAVAALLLMGYALVDPQSPPVIMELVGAALPQAIARPYAGAPATAASVRFSAPKVVRTQPTSAPAEDVPDVSGVAAAEQPARTAMTHVNTAAAHAPRSLRTPRSTAGRSTGATGGATRPFASHRPVAAAAPVQRIDVSQEVAALTEAGAAAVGSTRGSRAAQSEIEAYTALLEQSLRDALEQVPGLDDGLKAEAEFRLLANGRATDARLIVSSHDDRFDAAVLQTIAALRLPPRPAGMPEIQRLPFRTHLRGKPEQ